MPMIFDILTLFPNLFSSVFQETILARAIAKKLIEVRITDMRQFGAGGYVDDYPFGGGPGMVISSAIVDAALQTIPHREEAYSIFLSPQGMRLHHSLARALATKQHLILLCGRYEGIDQRIIDRDIDLEVSLGDFVLSGGEIPAMALVDCVSRFIPGVLGNAESAGEDSFEHNLLEGPVYTRPQDFAQREVPAVLLSGNHKLIRQWRKDQALKTTLQRRSDLLQLG